MVYLTFDKIYELLKNRVMHMICMHLHVDSTYIHTRVNAQNTFVVQCVSPRKIKKMEVGGRRGLIYYDR